ncbi:hypothetical protein RCV04_24215, partial [Escherichia coli]|nr:hypothetical protein [Escherichia coli]
KFIQNSILMVTKTTIFLSVFLWVFGLLFCVCGLRVVVCAVLCVSFGYKDRENDIFRYKKP